MRELHAWHEAKRHYRHVLDAAAGAPAARACDSPEYEVLRDPPARVAKHLEYRKIVEAAEARYAAGQIEPQEAKPGHAPPETRDKPAGKIAERRVPPENRQHKQRRPEPDRHFRTISRETPRLSPTAVSGATPPPSAQANTNRARSASDTYGDLQCGSSKW